MAICATLLAVSYIDAAFSSAGERATEDAGLYAVTAIHKKGGALERLLCQMPNLGLLQLRGLFLANTANQKARGKPSQMKNANRPHVSVETSSKFSVIPLALALAPSA